MISIDWASGIITVPQSFLTPLGGASYELDLDDFRLALKDLEDDEEGMPWPRTHNHNTEVTLAGITFARSIEVIQPYRVMFEDGVYGVNLVGANSNIPDVLVRNSVSVNSQNSAGLILATVGGIDEQTVRDALTAQGYTTARAPKLDSVDVAVSTRAVPGEGLSSAQDTKLTQINSRVDVAVSTREVVGAAEDALDAIGLDSTQVDKLDNLDATVSSRAQPGQGLTSGQAAAMLLLDVAISTRAAPGEGLSSQEATALTDILAATDIPTSTVAALVWARVVDGSITAEQSVRLMNAVLGGKVSGAGTATETFRNPGDTKDRVVATVDVDGNRTAIVRDLT